MQQEFTNRPVSLYHLDSAEFIADLRYRRDHKLVVHKRALSLTWKIVYRPSLYVTDSVYLYFTAR